MSKLELTFSPALEFWVKFFFGKSQKHPKINPWAKFQAISELFQILRHFAFQYNIMLQFIFYNFFILILWAASVSFYVVEIHFSWRTSSHFKIWELTSLNLLKTTVYLISWSDFSFSTFAELFMASVYIADFDIRKKQFFSAFQKCIRGFPMTSGCWVIRHFLLRLLL